MIEERAFLLAILERPDDDAPKLIYADWLEERGDPRAEFLRMMVKVRQKRAVTPEQRQQHEELSAELAELHAPEHSGRDLPLENWERYRRVRELEGRLETLSRKMRKGIPARLQALAATFDPTWLAVVSDPDIEGCGKNSGGGRSLLFYFICDQSWADMKPTGDDAVRHCETCRKNVYFCDNIADAREHSREGHCIAVDLGVRRRVGDLRSRLAFLGRASRVDVRQCYEKDVDSVSQARLDARKRAGEQRTGRQ
jgi:uncharacterized protein (TIGR02996 family)